VRQCGPGLLISTFLRIASEPLGFDTQNVTDVALPFSRYRTVGAEARFADNLVARLRALPSVRAASTSASWPFQANGLTPIDVAGVTTAPDRAPQAFTFIVGTRFFDSLGIRIVRGRDFTDADGPRSLAVAVVNEAMARRAFAGDEGRRTAASRDAIRRVGPLTLSAVLLVLALVSCAASYVPARSASGIDPNVTLRCE
jgi:hypothetical protein